MHTAEEEQLGTEPSESLRLPRLGAHMAAVQDRVTLQPCTLLADCHLLQLRRRLSDPLITWYPRESAHGRFLEDQLIGGIFSLLLGVLGAFTLFLLCAMIITLWRWWLERPARKVAFARLHENDAVAINVDADVRQQGDIEDLRNALAQADARLAAIRTAAKVAADRATRAKELEMTKSGPRQYTGPIDLKWEAIVPPSVIRRRAWLAANPVEEATDSEVSAEEAMEVNSDHNPAGLLDGKMAEQQTVWQLEEASGATSSMAVIVPPPVAPTASAALAVTPTDFGTLEQAMQPREADATMSEWPILLSDRAIINASAKATDPWKLEEMWTAAEDWHLLTSWFGSIFAVISRATPSASCSWFSTVYAPITSFASPVVPALVAATDTAPSPDAPFDAPILAITHPRSHDAPNLTATTPVPEACNPHSTDGAQPPAAAAAAAPAPAPAPAPALTSSSISTGNVVRGSAAGSQNSANEDVKAKRKASLLASDSGIKIAERGSREPSPILLRAAASTGSGRRAHPKQPSQASTACPPARRPPLPVALAANCRAGSEVRL